MQELSCFYGHGEYEDREAYVRWCSDRKEYFVDMKITNELGNSSYSELRSMGYHNEQYAEDCAENFIMGYGKINQ